ncbi:MAG TPA: MFS transporter [Candidatus Saccharibacteria bacterium]|nr:MFS transporter [Candidatus Saccharibacteria bacterium]HMR38303.1 MFS transporter [Candidatus Saccharibacteria bacterium]
MNIFSRKKIDTRAPKKGGGTKDLEGIDPITYARRWWILGTLCLTLLGVMLANSSLNMALPMMAKDLTLSQLDLTWVVNVYTLVFASLLFVAGAVGDRYGRKLAMQIGLAIFTLGSLYAGFLAQTGAELIISRIVMGMGAAFVMPTTLSIINNTFPKGERARAVAIWGAVAGVGMMFGSVISGILLEHFSWHSLFYFSAAIAIIGLIANQYLAHESKDEKETPVDWLGGVLSSLAIFGIVYGVTEAPSVGVAEPAVAASLIGGLVMLVLFVLWERRTKTPMLDMDLFKNRAFAISSLTLTLVFLAMSGVFFSMSQLMQLVMNYTPLESSLRTIPLMLPMMFISPLVPNIVKKIGARTAIGIGLTLTSIAFLIMSTWTIDLTYGFLFVTMLIMMLGITLAMTPGTNILMASVPRNRSGMGSAMNDTTRELGGALGVAVLGAVLSASYENSIAETAAKFPGAIGDALQSSLAVAMQVADKLGPLAEQVVHAAQNAFMNGVSHSALIAAAIIFAAALIAFFGLPKHTSKESDTI